jgi:uncharacterized membrane protein YccC
MFKTKYPMLTLFIAIVIGFLMGHILKNYKIAFGVTLLVAFLISVNLKGK